MPARPWFVAGLEYWLWTSAVCYCHVVATTAEYIHVCLTRSMSILMNGKAAYFV